MLPVVSRRFSTKMSFRHAAAEVFRRQVSLPMSLLWLLYYCYGGSCFTCWL